MYKKIINLKLEKFEKWDEYITNVKPSIRPTTKDAINAIAAQVLTYWSENIDILCHCPYSLVPPYVNAFTSTFKVQSEHTT